MEQLINRRGLLLSRKRNDLHRIGELYADNPDIKIDSALITSAPELLRTLKMVIDVALLEITGFEQSETFKIAEDVIKKAGDHRPEFIKRTEVFCMNKKGKFVKAKK